MQGATPDTVRRTKKGARLPIQCAERRSRARLAIQCATRELEEEAGRDSRYSALRRCWARLQIQCADLLYRRLPMEDNVHGDAHSDRLPRVPSLGPVWTSRLPMEDNVHGGARLVWISIHPADKYNAYN